MGSKFSSEQSRHRILFWLVEGTRIEARFGREAHVHGVDIRNLPDEALAPEEELEATARAFLGHTRLAARHGGGRAARAITK